MIMGRKLFEIKGDCMGVRIEERLPEQYFGETYHPDPLVTIMVEDDENWFDGEQFDVAWLDEMIRVLTAAKDFLDRQTKEKTRPRK